MQSGEASSLNLETRTWEIEHEGSVYEISTQTNFDVLDKSDLSNKLIVYIPGFTYSAEFYPYLINELKESMDAKIISPAIVGHKLKKVGGGYFEGNTFDKIDDLKRSFLKRVLEEYKPYMLITHSAGGFSDDNATASVHINPSSGSVLALKELINYFFDKQNSKDSEYAMKTSMHYMSTVARNYRNAIPLLFDLKDTIVPSGKILVAGNKHYHDGLFDFSQYKDRVELIPGAHFSLMYDPAVAKRTVEFLKQELCLKS